MASSPTARIGQPLPKQFLGSLLCFHRQVVCAVRLFTRLVPAVVHFWGGPADMLLPQCHGLVMLWCATVTAVKTGQDPHWLSCIAATPLIQLSSDSIQRESHTAYNGDPLFQAADHMN